MTQDLVAAQGTAVVPLVRNRAPSLRALLRSTAELAFDVADELVERMQGLVARR